MLLARADGNQRVAAALRRAGYRPVVPTNLQSWAARQDHSLLLTTDSDRSLALLRDVVAAGADARAVVLVQEPGSYRYRSLLRHCVAVLPVGSTDDEIVLAVDAAHRELSCLPTTAARTLVGALDDRTPSLTDNERAWLRALARSATVASLARASGYSQREMYRLLGELYRRLGVSTRTEALLRADRLGLLHPPAVASQSRRPTTATPTGRLER